MTLDDARVFVLLASTLLLCVAYLAREPYFGYLLLPMGLTIFSEVDAWQGYRSIAAVIGVLALTGLTFTIRRLVTGEGWTVQPNHGATAIGVMAGGMIVPVVALVALRAI